MKKTVLYAEYKNTGEGAAVKNRVAWSKQLTDKEAKEYTVQNIFMNNSSADTPQENSWLQSIPGKPFEWPVKK